MSNLFDDQPISADLLEGLEKLSDRLASRISGFPASSPVLISGPWGSGKTSLLKSVGENLTSAGSTVCLFEA